MEFERSMFRIHEKLLKGPRNKKVLFCLEGLCGVLTLASLACLLISHFMFVNKSDILKPAIETQLNAYFHKLYAARNGNIPHEIASIELKEKSYLVKYSIKDKNLYDVDYSSMPQLSLNYSETTGAFIMDNKSIYGQENILRSISLDQFSKSDKIKEIVPVTLPETNTTDPSNSTDP